jgi:hypothetical protein
MTEGYEALRSLLPANATKRYCHCEERSDEATSLNSNAGSLNNNALSTLAFGG